jgi:hypothetical protein
MSDEVHGVYKQGYGNDDNYYVDGPCPGGECSFYGGTLYPQFRFEDKEMADKVSKLMNIAYSMGRRSLQCDMRKLLGVG